MRKTREQIEYQLSIKRNRLELYLKREAEMLDGGVQSYGIGSRNLARYNTDLGSIRAAIKQLEADIEALEAALNGEKPKFLNVLVKYLPTEKAILEDCAETPLSIPQNLVTTSPSGRKAVTMLLI